MKHFQRLKRHPVLDIPRRENFIFYFNDEECVGVEGESISSSLFANGIKVFGHHHLDKSPLGIFCANGQCSQCMVIVEGLAVKSCMTVVKPGMRIYPCNGLPKLQQLKKGEIEFEEIENRECDVLIVGGGPSGISAGIELGKCGYSVILVDDKDSLGGKLVLQTHTFFGSIDDCYAGTRGIDIAKILTKKIKEQEKIDIFLNSSAIGVFNDKKVGIINRDKYFLVKPRVLLIASGAREKALSFPGWTIPGVYGAGAFQTLLNRDFVKSSEKLFIIGGGNVGLIAAYHALQGGINVVGLAEAMGNISGYKVHGDKIKKLGVPIYTSHSIIKALGDEGGVKKVVIGELDGNFNIISGTEKDFEVDTVLVAVGLNPIRELFDAAIEADMKVYTAGDSKEIAEASAAMFSGRITALKIAQELGSVIEIPESLYLKEEILKSKPQKTVKRHYKNKESGVFPVFHCSQEIPCNPCTKVCPQNSIFIKNDSLMGIPEFEGKCIGCGKCLAICPGLAITLVDYRRAEKGFAHVTVPYELSLDSFKVGKNIGLTDNEGRFLIYASIVKLSSPLFADKTSFIMVKVPSILACKVAGVRIQFCEEIEKLKDDISNPQKDDPIICSCMRVRKSQIVKLIREGVRDLNQLKGSLQVGMGACNGKTCENIIMGLFKEEGIDLNEVVSFKKRPPIMETSLGTFAGLS